MKIRVFKSKWRSVIRPWRYECPICFHLGYFWKWRDAFDSAFAHIQIHPTPKKSLMKTRLHYDDYQDL